MLFTLIVKNLLQRPLRYVLTGLAIAFGVAAVTAVFIFTDGLRTTFDELGADIQGGFDIAIQSDSPFGDNFLAPPVPVELRDQLLAIDGVEAAQPRIIEFGIVAIDGDDEALIANGPNFGVNWESRTPNPRLFLKEGREPLAAEEFAIDIDGFQDGNFEVGGTYTVLTPEGSIPMELVGTFSFADEEANALVGAILIAFSEEEALRVLNGGEGYDDIVLVVDGDSADVLPDIEAVIEPAGDTLIAVDQQVLIDDQAEGFGQILNIFRTVLLVFAVIILLVSAFLIFNVFTITLGQRIKEIGLLRSVGAYGSQVTSMMLGEALILGVIATLVGIPSGWLLAKALRFGLSQFGFPGDTGLPVEPLTLAIAVGVGVIVTLLAASFPSIRARSVTPIDALREGALAGGFDSEPSVPRGLAGVVIGLLLTILGFVVGGWIGLLFLPLVGGVAGYAGLKVLGGLARRFADIALLVFGVVLLTIVRFSDMGLGATFGLLGAGAMLTIVGASLVSGMFATPAARAIGYPIPLAIIVGIIGVAFGAGAIGSVIGMIVLLADGKIWAISLLLAVAILAVGSYALVRTAKGAFGLTGRLARENAARNPSRTATTATALMIGLSLVTAVTVIGESIKDSVSNALDSSVTSDWLVTGPSNGPGGLPFSSEVVDVLEDTGVVDEVVPFRFTFGGLVSLQGVELETVEAAVPRLFSALGDRDDVPAVLDDLKIELGITELKIDDLFSTDFATVQNHIDPDFVTVDESVDPARAIWIADTVAEDQDLAMGDTFVALLADGDPFELTVSGIYEDEFIFGERVVDNSVWEAHLPSDTYGFISATTAPGVDTEVAREALVASLDADYPILSVQDRAEFSQEQTDQINQTLAVVNVLLLLSAVIAILGIAIALALAVFERTREIGLLRAVGTTREQTRWIVRWEGVIVAAFGGIIGVIVGVGLGILATQKLPEFLVNTTSVPIPQLIAYIIVAAVTGLGAGAFPAWVAGRMDVLDAISNE